jgi:hypothetical protein
MNRIAIAAVAASVVAMASLSARVMAQDPNEGTPVATSAQDASAALETTTAANNPARDAYVAALDGLPDEQTPMVPVVLAAVGELSCDGLEVDHQKAAAFISSRAANETPESRKEAADNAKAATATLLGPWLTYVEQDAGSFCEKAYALHDGGRDLWKHS